MSEFLKQILKVENSRDFSDKGSQHLNSIQNQEFFARIERLVISHVIKFFFKFITFRKR